jgi:sigma-B regulation protein RsbU (phosphoserine phosphatase)
MTTPETLAFRSQLLDRRARLQSARAARLESADLTRLLGEIDSALERMEQHTYGLCEVCHDPIEPDRLMADPLVRFCLAHLTDQQQAALEKDIELAGRIQATLLPSRNVKGGGWEASYHYEPAGPVGGDYCDLLPSASGGLFFVTGDVSGKGVASSLLMPHLHAIFRSLLSVGMPIGTLMETANRLFCESTLPSFYATLVCGHADAGGEIEICNAGHCPPVLFAKGETLTIAANSLPLGLFCAGEYPSRRMRLGAGDYLILYTDGLTEARSKCDQEYTIERLTKTLKNCYGLPTQAVASTCLGDLQDFLEGAPKSDDLTLMVIRRA